MTTQAATINWPGQSGQLYQYFIYLIGTEFNEVPGNYIFCKQSSPGNWTPIYIGQTGNLKERLPNHEKLPCVRRNGGTHVHVHESSPVESIRRAEEDDLIARWGQIC